MIRHFSFLVVIILLNACAKQPSLKTTLELNQNWSFKNSTDSIWYAATVPGTIHTDLLANKLIEDPFYRNNELKLQWIENENWDYESIFTVDKETIKRNNIEITFDGIDTYANVFLNDSLILTCNNMFRKWSVNIKDLILFGENKLRINFTSALNYNREKANSYPYSFPADNDKVEPKVSPFTRKAAYHFGWDWAPRLVPLGIWQKITLSSWDNAKIQNTFIRTLYLDEDRADIEIEIEFQCLKEQELVIVLFGEKNRFVIRPDNHVITIPHTIIQPEYWWPNGLGIPHLYYDTIEVNVNGNKIDEQAIRFGLREIELIHEKDSIGTSFYFIINDEPLFIKGANYVPQDVFLPRVKPQQYRSLLVEAKDANMNMIRVWGGGIYEQDLFYNLCDSLGLLVWQDFMFAGTMYPADQPFLANVEIELIEQIKRLRNHACLAIWCGNNEIEVAWQNWGWQKKYNYGLVDSTNLWQNYEWLFKEKIPGLVEEYSPAIPYTSTTPLSNWGTPENFNHATMHYWGVWHGKEKFESYKKNIGRFMVEYGFQSYPSLPTLQKFTAIDDLDLQSPVMTNRQKSYIGNKEILLQIENYFSIPKNFEDFVMLSQKTQAIALTKAIKAHLRKEGHCMGSIFWQLNDCWPGPSWSVIDYYGVKKEAYYSVQTAFE